MVELYVVFDVIAHLLAVHQSASPAGVERVGAVFYPAVAHAVGLEHHVHRCPCSQLQIGLRGEQLRCGRGQYDVGVDGAVVRRLRVDHLRIERHRWFAHIGAVVGPLVVGSRPLHVAIALVCGDIVQTGLRRVCGPRLGVLAADMEVFLQLADECRPWLGVHVAGYDEGLAARPCHLCDDGERRHAVFLGQRQVGGGKHVVLELCHDDGACFLASGQCPTLYP